MLSQDYMNLDFSLVQHSQDLYKSIKPTLAMRLKTMESALSSVFGPTHLRLYIATVQDVFKFDILDNKNSNVIGEFVYMPNDHRLDILSDGALLMQIKNKTVVGAGYNEFYKKLGFSKLFDRFTINL